VSAAKDAEMQQLKEQNAHMHDQHNDSQLAKVCTILILIGRAPHIQHIYRGLPVLNEHVLTKGFRLRDVPTPQWRGLLMINMLMPVHQNSFTHLRVLLVRPDHGVVRKHARLM
jgi:hypothetical protein